MKTLFKYLFMSISAALCLPVVTACDDEEAVDPYDINYVYIYSPTASDNTLEYKGNGTFLVDVEPHSVINPVRCTKPAPEDLTIRCNGECRIGKRLYCQLHLSSVLMALIINRDSVIWLEQKNIILF